MINSTKNGLRQKCHAFRHIRVDLLIHGFIIIIIMRCHTNMGDDLEASTSEMNTSERNAVTNDVQWASARQLRPC
jgi:hypothetical protein